MFVLNVNYSSAQKEIEFTPDGVVLPRLDSAEIIALTPIKGTVIFNTQIDAIQYYDGSEWIVINDFNQQEGTNTIYGQNAGDSIVLVASHNSLFGYRSGHELKNVIGNSFFGALSGEFNKIGALNSYFGLGSGINSESGFRNSFFGNASGRFIKSGDDNSFFGNESGVEEADSNLNYALALGARARVACNNCAVIGGNTNATEVNVGISTNHPESKLHILRGEEASLAENGYVTLGEINGSNITLDTQRIVARRNGGEANLFLNPGSGNVAIGNPSSFTSKLQVNSSSNESPFRAQISGQTKFVIRSNGAITVGANAGAASDAVYLANNYNLGIGIADPQSKLHIIEGAEATLTEHGYLNLGETGKINMAIDLQRIVVRNNGAASPLYLNDGSGEVLVGDVSSPDAKLHINSEASEHGLKVQVDGGTKMLVRNNGSTTFGTSAIVQANTVYLPTNYRLGIGEAFPGHPIELGSGARCTSTGVWVQGSDIAYKENIQPISYGLETILAMRPTQYHYKASGEHSIGFIAQEMENIIPEVVSGEEGKKGIGYGLLTAVLVKAIQEQQSEISELKALVKSLVEGND